ncbi:MAG: DUF402 domain-containing protein [Chloroflexi bacterium]|nr:DUF402 domain-containing protein [Chloroflexota bacterium]MDA1240273.1 DUF402 domain-containing protein [Chloroflexota bacterium]
MTEDAAAALGPPTTVAGRRIHVLSKKFDGSTHYSYTARFIDQAGPLIRVWVEAREPYVSYRGEGLMREGFTALFFTDRWYNIFHNLRPMGRRGYLTYTNVGTPATFDGETLRWVDLDVDIVRTVDAIHVDDEDEFALHAQTMAYPDDLVDRVRATRDEVLRLVETDAFPFNRMDHLPRP